MGAVFVFGGLRLRKYDISKNKDRTELSRLADEFIAAGGKITKCPPANPTGDVNSPVFGDDYPLQKNYFSYLEDESQHLSDNSRRHIDLGDGCRQYLPELNDE